MKTKIGLPFGLALVVFIGIFTIMLALGALNPQRAEAVDDFSVSLSNAIPGHNSDWSFSVQAEDGFSAATGVTGAANEVASTIGITFTDFTTSGTAAETAGNWKLGGETVTEASSGGGGLITLTAPDGMDAVLEDGELSVEYTAPMKGLVADGFANPTTPGEYMLSVVIMVDTDANADLDTTSATLESEAFSIDTTRVGQLEVTASPDDPGAAAQYQIKFYTGVALQEGTGIIILEIDSSVGVPTSLSERAVRISASELTNEV